MLSQPCISCWALAGASRSTLVTDLRNELPISIKSVESLPLVDTTTCYRRHESEWYRYVLRSKSPHHASPYSIPTPCQRQSSGTNNRKRLAYMKSSSPIDISQHHQRNIHNMMHLPQLFLPRRRQIRAHLRQSPLVKPRLMFHSGIHQVLQYRRNGRFAG